MNDVSTNEAQSAEDWQAAASYGRHRGPLSTEDAETSPRGRHRKAAQENERADSAA